MSNYSLNLFKEIITAFNQDLHDKEFSANLSDGLFAWSGK